MTTGRINQVTIFHTDTGPQKATVSASPTGAGRSS